MIKEKPCGSTSHHRVLCAATTKKGRTDKPCGRNSTPLIGIVCQRWAPAHLYTFLLLRLQKFLQYRIQLFLVRDGDRQQARISYLPESML